MKSIFKFLGCILGWIINIVLGVTLLGSMMLALVVLSPIWVIMLLVSICYYVGIWWGLIDKLKYENNEEDDVTNESVEETTQEIVQTTLPPTTTTSSTTTSTFTPITTTPGPDSTSGNDVF